VGTLENRLGFRRFPFLYTPACKSLAAIPHVRSATDATRNPRVPRDERRERYLVATLSRLTSLIRLFVRWAVVAALKAPRWEYTLVVVRFRYTPESKKLKIFQSRMHQTALPHLEITRFAFTKFVNNAAESKDVSHALCRRRFWPSNREVIKKIPGRSEFTVNADRRKAGHRGYAEVNGEISRIKISGVLPSSVYSTTPYTSVCVPSSNRLILIPSVARIQFQIGRLRETAYTFFRRFVYYENRQASDRWQDLAFYFNYERIFVRSSIQWPR